MRLHSAPPLSIGLAVLLALGTAISTPAAAQASPTAGSTDSANPTALGQALMQSIQNKRFAEAIEQADRLLSLQPEQPEWLLQRGVALLNLGQENAAAQLFERLLERYPNHSAPLINLAAVRARQNRLDEARALLVRAVEQGNSNRLEAQQSLANVYLGLAWQTYQQILAQAPANADTALLQKRLTAIELALKPSNAGPAQNLLAQTPASNASTGGRALRLSPNAAALAETAPLRNQSLTIQKVALQVPPENPTTAPAGLTEGGTTALPLTETLANTLEGWRQAWQQADLNAYSGYYAANFRSPTFNDRAAWLAYKQRVFANAGKIQLELSQIQWETRGEWARVSFQQRYQSQVYQANDRKQLEWRQTPSGWKIQREISLSGTPQPTQQPLAKTPARRVTPTAENRRPAPMQAVPVAPPPNTAPPSNSTNAVVSFRY
ncbi:tetratricopeptide repeat protein [Parvibium lacunae]|uniref:Cds6 C-terminal domain-containing protein n=1 Tax=Parvibium lacunae TaxID=1888893 RepID=A0A368L0X6_9BURK|nr:tetratricopeptide repeat protein [Parvibium lacunae]RCS57057.1 hypothetical protein DU000_09630 [Parvibium lacunae]